MNVYQMYHENKCQTGFYVIRNSWRTVIAKITKIEGVKDGEKMIGEPPYYGNPNPKVYAKLYKVVNNESDCPENLCSSINFIEETELSCPGTHSYRMVN